MNLRRLAREGTRWSHPKVPLRGAAALTIAKMPARIGAGGFGYAFTGRSWGAKQEGQLDTTS
jgi:hypothetical protein